MDEGRKEIGMRSCISGMRVPTLEDVVGRLKYVSVIMPLRGFPR